MITQVCRTIASVGMIDPVKVEIAQRGGIKVLCYLVSFIEDEDLNIHCKLQNFCDHRANQRVHGRSLV